jgi:hypothetical protein
VESGNNPQSSATLNYEIASYENGEVYRGLRVQARKPLKVHPTNPLGICDFADVIEIVGGGLSVPIRCPGTGATTVALQPIAGVSSAQPVFTVRIISLPAPPAPLLSVNRAFTGNGLETELPLSPGPGTWVRTLTSSDPERVRLSLDRKASGTAAVTAPLNGTRSYPWTSRSRRRTFRWT